MDTARMKQRARDFGADLVGVAPLERFANEPPERQPKAIFPQAKCVVVVGRAIPRGALRALAGRAPAPSAFGHFGFKALEDNYLARTTYDLCVWIESQGYEAAPLFGYDVDAAAKVPLAVPVAPDKPAPNVYLDWQRAGEAAGLGTTGKNGLFLTPEFGPRQRLAMLISDFPFEPDPVRAFAACDGCSACEAACPSAALTDGQRDNDRCLACKTGAVATDFGRFNTVERVGAACGRACLASLEARGLLTQTFARPYVHEEKTA